MTLKNESAKIVVIDGIMLMPGESAEYTPEGEPNPCVETFRKMGLISAVSGKAAPRSIAARKAETGKK